MEQHIAELKTRSMHLYKVREYNQAFALAGEAVALARQHLGDSHPLLAESLDHLATLHLSDPDYEVAWQLFAEALIVTRRVLGADHPKLATILNNVASLHEELGDYMGAAPLYREALEVRRRSLGESDPLFATSLNNLAELLHTIGDYAEAQSLYEQAIAVLRKSAGDQHPNVATGLDNLANLYQELGNYAAAEPIYQEALAIRRATLGESHPQYATTLNNLGQLYESMGNYAAAEPLFEQALTIRRHTVGEHDPAYGRVLSNLAGLHASVGNYSAAVPLYRQVIAIDHQTIGEHHETYATHLNNLAAVYQATAHYTEAEALFKQALDIDRVALGENHAHYAMDLSNLAALYEATGDYAAALPLAQQALARFRNAFGEHHPHVAAVLDNLALLHQRVGRPDQAEELLKQALQTQQSTLGPAHPLIAKTLNSLGFVAYETGAYDQAEHYYRHALRMQQKLLGRQHSDIAASLANLATLYAATGRIARALALVRHASSIDDLVIEQVFAMGSERQRMNYLAALARDFYIFLSLIIRHQDQFPRARQLGLELVLRRKGLGAEALAAQRDAVLGGRYPTLAADLSKLTNLRMQIARRALSGPGDEGRATHEQVLAAWHREKDTIESELARQIPEIRLRRHFQEVNAPAVAAAIPPDCTLIEFVRYSRFDFAAIPAQGNPSWKAPHYLALVLNRGAPEQVQILDLGDADLIDRLVVEFRALITHSLPASRRGATSDWRSVRDEMAPPESSSAAQFLAVGGELRRRIFDPLQQTRCLQAALLLVPDGDLTSLPFEVLPLGTGRHLIDEYRISYLSAGRDVLRMLVEAPGPYTAPVVAAAPDFDFAHAETTPQAAGHPVQELDDTALAFAKFDNLPGTAAEGQQVGALLGVQPLLGQAVLESTLKRCRSPRILHIATHGFFLPGTGIEADWEAPEPEPVPGALTRLLDLARLENPLLRSGLVLAGVNTWLKHEELPVAAEDGILTAEDVTGLDLLSTDLVVLSACETGLGQVEIGEGVYGLRRAFMLAGARALVMTLWKVPDQQTRELMIDFYRRILAGEPRATALRAAQLAMKARNPDPLYWGAYICQGDPGPLRGGDLAPDPA